MNDLADALNTAVAHHRSGRLDEAAKLYREVLDERPDQPDALHLLGVLSQQRGDSAAAEDFIRRAIALDPRQAIFHNNLGRLLADREAWAAAEDAYRKALALSPGYAEAHNNLGIVLHETGRFAEAEASYRRALAIRGTYVDAHNNLGITLRERGDVAGSLACFRRAIELEPGHAAAHSNLAAALRQKGDVDDAVAHYRRAIEIKPDFVEALLSLARLLFEAGRGAEAEHVYRRLLEIAPDHQQATQQLTVLLASQGRHGEGRDVREALLRRRPETLDFPLGQLLAAGYDDPMHYETLGGGPARPAWHFDGTARFFPLHVSSKAPLAELIEQFVLRDRPKHPPIFGADARLITFGSCFAEHLRRELLQRGRMSEHIDVPEGLNNSFALRDFLAWALAGRRGTEAYWYNRKEADRAVLWTPELEQAMYAGALKEADGFVLTFGLAEVWRDRATGGVFWRGVPSELYDPARHELVLSSVDENYRNMREIHDLVRAHCGDLPIVFTLSPVPLNATFRDSSCLEADCVSKATLRLAIDRLLQEKLPGLYYWPSFEIVRWLGSHLGRPMFAGQYDETPSRERFDDARHVRPDVVACIVDAFIRGFFRGEAGGERQREAAASRS